MIPHLSVHPASTEVASALAGLGHMEDVAFSPSDRRVALAEYSTDRVLILDLEVGYAPAGGVPTEVSVTGVTALHGEWFSHPHGLSFIDDELLVVGNRRGTVVIVAVPSPFAGVRELHHDAAIVFEADGACAIASPGSVWSAPLAPGVAEVFACNNYEHRISRHVVDTRERRVLSAENFYVRDRGVPDGIASTGDRRWLAVSFHDDHEVHVFERTPLFAIDARPVAALRGIDVPHGLEFSPDGRFLFVAEAGLPCLRVFARGDTWTGDRDVCTSFTVMDDDAYARGHWAHDEGGPKGLTLNRSGRVVAVTSHEIPLAFFDVERLTGMTPGEAAAPSAADDMRHAYLREMAGAAALTARIEALEHTVAERDRQLTVLAKWSDGLLGRVTRQP